MPVKLRTEQAQRRAGLAPLRSRQASAMASRPVPLRWTSCRRRLAIPSARVLRHDVLRGLIEAAGYPCHSLRDADLLLFAEPTERLLVVERGAKPVRILNRAAPADVPPRFELARHNARAQCAREI